MDGVGRGEREAHGLVPGGFHADGLGLREDLDHADACAGSQAVGRCELEEGGVLIADAGDEAAVAGAELAEGCEIALDKPAVGIGDGIAVRVDRGVVEEGVEAVEHLGGERVLEAFCFVVYFGPVEAECLDEEHLDEPVAADHVDGEPAAFRGERDAAVPLGVGEARLAELADHGGHAALGDAEGCGEADDRGLAGGRILLEQVDRFDVVLDG